MKKILKYSFIGLAALCTALLCGGYYMLGHALNPDELITRSRNSQASYEYMFGQYPELKPWVDSLQTAGALRDFYIKNDRGETLHALYVAAAEPTRKTAVIVHGYTDNSIRMLNIGYLYNRQLKYNILLPDLHGHGASEGAEIQMGWLDRLDVLQWTATADELFGRNNETVTAGDSTRMRSSGTEMVVHGISMGAATTMMVSGEVEHGIHQQPFIKCFVEDCGYTSVWDEFRGELKAQYGLWQADFASKSTDGISVKLRLWSRSESVPCPCSLYTAMRTPMCLHGWSTLFTKPSRNRKSCGLFRVPHMPCPTRTIRRNIRSM